MLLHSSLNPLFLIKHYSTCIGQFMLSCYWLINFHCRVSCYSPYSELCTYNSHTIILHVCATHVLVLIVLCMSLRYSAACAIICTIHCLCHHAIRALSFFLRYNAFRAIHAILLFENFFFSCYFRSTQNSDLFSFKTF